MDPIKVAAYPSGGKGLALDANGKLPAQVLPRVQSNGTDVGGRHNLNLIAGTGVALTITDTPASDRVDITVATATPPAVQASNSAPQTTTTAVVFVCLLDTTVYDASSPMHSTSVNTSRLTCKLAGLFLITAGAGFIANAVGGRELDIRLNGTTYLANQNNVPVPGVTHNMVTTALARLAVNDYVEMIAYQTSGGNLNVNANAFTATWLSA